MCGVPSRTLWTQAVTLYGWEGLRASGEFMYSPHHPQVRIPSHQEPHHSKVGLPACPVQAREQEPSWGRGTGAWKTPLVSR